MYILFIYGLHYECVVSLYITYVRKKTIFSFHRRGMLGVSLFTNLAIYQLASHTNKVDCG